jgi:lysozyme
MKFSVLIFFIAALSLRYPGKYIFEKTEPESLKKSIPENPIDTLILGIDVSHFQGEIDWNKIKEAKIQFAYDKATQGNHYKDPEYDKNKSGARSAGLIHGSYHFFTSNQPGIDQAKHFCTVVDYGKGDMPPVLDLEQGSILGDVVVESFQKEVLDWLNEVERTLGVKPIIYTNHPFGDKYLDHPDFSDYELWIAEYGVSTPKIPKRWTDKGWLIWQRSERGAIEGAIGDVDHDLFNPSRSFNNN